MTKSKFKVTHKKRRRPKSKQAAKPPHHQQPPNNNNVAKALPQLEPLPPNSNQMNNISPPHQDQEWMTRIQMNSNTCFHTVLSRNKHNYKSTLKEFKKYNAPNSIQDLIKSGLSISCPIERMFKYDSFFKGKDANENPFLPQCRVTVVIHFSDILNTMLPTDLIGRNGSKNIVVVEATAGCEQLFSRKAILKYDHYPYYQCMSKRWIRVGDFLHPNQVTKVISLCNNNYYNLGVLLLICCHHMYHKAVHKMKPSEREEKQQLVTKYGCTEINGLVQVLNKIAIQLSDVMEEELASRSFAGIRSDWAHWNPFIESSDSYFSNPAMIQWRLDLRAKHAEEKMNKSEDNSGMELMAYFIIMLSTQQQNDGTSEETTYKLFNGRHDSFSFLKYLQKHSMRDFFVHFAAMFRSG